MKRVLGLLAVAGACGCSAVYCTAPVGTVPVALDEDAARALSGTWSCGDTFLAVSVADAANGVINVAWFEAAGSRLTPRAGTAHLRAHRGRELISLLDEKESAPGRPLYLWGLAKRRGNDVLVWPPAFDRARARVADGGWGGSTNKHRVILEPLTAAQLDELLEPRFNPFFAWEDPLIFRKAAP